MNRIAILLVFFLSKSYNTFTYNDRYGVDIVYNIAFLSECGLETDARRFRRFVGGSLSTCVRECGLRPHCESLSYRRRIPLCDLFNTTVKGEPTSDDCTFISASDIKVKQNPCQNCLYGQVCDIRSKECIYEECLDKEIDKGTFMGNGNQVGSKIRYKCYYGYKSRNNVEMAVCQNNGTWTTSADCEDKVYTLVTDNFDWWNAKSNCEALGGRLADVKSAVAQLFIEENVLPPNDNLYWIGGSRVSGRLVWLDGTEVTDGYQNWYSGEPSSYSEKCMMVLQQQNSRGYLWHDAPCDWQIGSLCKFD